MLRREVENTVIDARKTMSERSGNGDAGSQAGAAKRRAGARAHARTSAHSSSTNCKSRLREAQRAAVIKDELDAAREEELAAARERRLLNDRMARNREKEKQLVDRFNALIDEGRLRRSPGRGRRRSTEVDPNGVTPVVALVSTEFVATTI